MRAGGAASRAAWRIFAVLAAAYIASQFFRVSNAVIAPELMRDLDISPEAMGAITGTFFLTFAAAQLPAGVLLDRFGPRWTMAGLLAFAVLGSLVFAAAGGGAGLTIGRGLMGLGCAVGLMGSLVVIARWFPPQRFAPMLSVLYAIGGLGSVLATTPLAAAAEAFGWRGAFVVMAAITAGLALLLWLVVRDSPAGHAATTTPESPREIWRGLVAVTRNRSLLHICGIQLVVYGCLTAVAGLWGGPYLENVHGLDAVARGNVLLAMNLAVLVGALGYGGLAPLFGSYRRPVVAGAALMAAAFAALALWPSPGVGTVVVLFVLIGLLSGHFNLLHAHARAVLPDHLVGRGLTLQNMAAIGGVFAWQAATGFIVGAWAGADGSAPPEAYRTVFGFLAVLMAAGLAAYLPCKDVRV